VSTEKVYSLKEIEKYLETRLPNWYYENGWIRRKYKTSGWKSTLMVINTIGHLAEAAWHHPEFLPHMPL
jgi:4a-hydroxytetrahydrobiopterin dehydratase